MIVVKAYTSDYAESWNEFVRQSKNGTFLFDRSYMDYHADRFMDASLMFFNARGKLTGLLPASISDGVVSSHGGLTYGGIVLSGNCHYSDVAEMFQSAVDFYAEQGVWKIIYKPVPYIYSKVPSDEGIYWLFQNGASLLERSMSSAVQLSAPLPFSELRQRKVRKATGSGLVVRLNDFSYAGKFWQILTCNLMKRHGVSPVHTLDEIRLLQKRFPENIFLSTVISNGDAVAGCVVYRTETVAHVQYIASDERGKELGALDMLFSELIEKYRKEGLQFLDFGISTEQRGAFLNEGLLFQKEGLGGRAVCYDTYEYKIPGTK